MILGHLLPRIAECFIEETRTAVDNHYSNKFFSNSLGYRTTELLTDGLDLYQATILTQTGLWKVLLFVLQIL